MLIEEGLKETLLADENIPDYVGERIYYVHAPQNVIAPYLVLTKISGPREHSHDGSSELAHPRFQISVFAKTYYEVKHISWLIQGELQGRTENMYSFSFPVTFPTDLGDVEIGGIFYDNETDMYEQETGLYHTALDYIIWHKET